MLPVSSSTRRYPGPREDVDHQVREDLLGPVLEYRPYGLDALKPAKTSTKASDPVVAVLFMP